MGGFHVVATLCGFVSLVLLLTSLASDHWVEESGNLGLWKYCVVSFLGTVCDDFGMDVKGFVHATRAFMILAVFPGFLACALLLVLFSRTEIGSYSIIRIVQISSFVAGGFALLALIIFTGFYRSTVSYGWSAILGWVGGALFLLTGGFALLALIIFTGTSGSTVSCGWSAILGWVGGALFLLSGSTSVSWRSVIVLTMGGWHVAATLCGFLSLVLLLTSLASDHWVETINLRFGLWKLCIVSYPNIACNDLGMHVKGFVHATRAFMILAVFPGFLACALLLVLFSRTGIGSYSIIRIVQISSFVAGGFALLALIIFTGTSRSAVSYGWSAILGWVGGALFLLTGLLAFKAITHEQN